MCHCYSTGHVLVISRSWLHVDVFADLVDGDDGEPDWMVQHARRERTQEMLARRKELEERLARVREAEERHRKKLELASRLTKKMVLDTFTRCLYIL